MALRAERRKAATIRSYAGVLGLFLRFLSTQDVVASKDIATRHVRLWMLGLERNLAPASFRDYVVSVKCWTKWMATEGVIPLDPAATIKPPKVPQKVVQPFSTSELAAMLEICEFDSKETRYVDWWLGLRNAAMLLVLLDTGMREGELAGMKMHHFLSSYSRVKLEDTKNGEERIVALSQDTQRAVLRYLLLRKKMQLAHDSVWIGRRGAPLTQQGIYEALVSIGKRAGVQKARFVHAFRHTAGTRMLVNGATERDVRDILGHKTEAMVRRYTASVGSERAAERHAAFSPVKGLRVK